MLAHRFALGLPRPVRREDGGGHPLPGLVREPHVVELHLPESHLRGFLRQLGGVDPDGVVVGVHPRDVDPVPPQLTRPALLDRPPGLPFREEGILGDHDTRDGIDAVLRESIEPRTCVFRTHAPVRADLLGGGHGRGVEQAAGVVFHVDDEGIDLGFVGEAHELPELWRPERPRVDVQSLDLRGRREQHGLLVDVPDLGWPQQNLDLVSGTGDLVGGTGGRDRGAVLRKKAATREERGQQENACLPDHNHRGLHDRNHPTIGQETGVTLPWRQPQAVE